MISIDPALPIPILYDMVCTEYFYLVYTQQLTSSSQSFICCINLYCVVVYEVFFIISVNHFAF